MKSLVVITRATAYRGGNDDEFCANWGRGDEELSLEFQAGDERRLVLVHSHNTRWGTRRHRDLDLAVREICNLVPDEGELGVLIHPDEDDITYQPIGDRLRATLGARIVFIGSHGQGEISRATPIGRLATAIKDGVSTEEVVPAFDCVWNHYAPNLPLEAKLELLHALLVPWVGDSDPPQWVALETAIVSDPEFPAVRAAWNAFRLSCRVGASSISGTDVAALHAYWDTEGPLATFRDALLGAVP